MPRCELLLNFFLIIYGRTGITMSLETFIKTSFSEHCQLEQWSAWEWSKGAKECGVGKRSRYVKVAALHGGDSCEKRYGKNFGKETKEVPCVGNFKRL